jgi:hypothetical protein
LRKRTKKSSRIILVHGSTRLPARLTLGEPAT